MPNWTDEQKNVISLKGRNLLVSAAAGSGKTAVLVERIIEMILDEENPIDIDKIVVVTFTNAAANQMKEKIFNRINSALEEDPNNERLLKTLPLVHKANITTIDSFCLDLVRNNFTYIDLDPSFRVADNGELALIKSDVVKELLEDKYAAREEKFLKCVDSFCIGKDDKMLEELVLEIADKVESFPWPEMWLDSCKEVYDISDKADFLAKEFIKDIVTDARNEVEKVYRDVCDAVIYYTDICNRETKEAEALFIAYKEAKIICDTILTKEYDEFYEGTRGVIELPRGKGREENAWYRSRLKEVRDTLKSCRDKYFSKSVDDIMNEFSGAKENVESLTALVKEFLRRFSQRKRISNIIDFSDMEHMALDILVKNNKGKLEYTKVAEELREAYEEIFIDEYQDSNEIQEQILMAISRECCENRNNNMFMVGDVKQSIYRFRMARPELFVGKYDKYSEYKEGVEGENVKIELQKNFRSRGHILASVNDIFMDIMKKSVGNVEYNEKAMLREGKEKNGFEYTKKYATEILIVETENVDDSEEIEDEKQEYTKVENEAMVIADRISQLVNDPEMKIYDEELEGFRKLQYKDIVILMRSAGKNADTTVEVLQGKGIPAMYNSDTGYFDSMEIREVLNYLAIIDNPRQDIPFYGTLISYFGSFDTNEVAMIRAYSKDKSLYDVFVNYKDNGPIEQLAEKCSRFYEKLNNMRNIVSYTKVSDLVWKIVFETGYYSYMETCWNTKTRQSNLEIFVEKAKVYEKTSFAGLFNFLRYIDKLKKYDVDYGSVSTVGKDDNMVSIMTIHKSKGLEFPVVFVSGMGKNHNKQDLKKSVICDLDYKIAIDDIQLDKRTKSETLYKKYVKDKVNKALIGEELRVLYVALTRAKDKLIMVGTLRDFEKKRDEYATVNEMEDRTDAIIKAAGYLDLIMPTVLKNRCGYFEPKLETISGKINKKAYEKKMYRMCDCKPFEYKYLEETQIRSKYAVSDIKHEKMEFYNVEAFVVNDKEPVPEFISNEKREPITQGAKRGNAYHKVMELLRYDEVDTVDDILKQIRKMEIEDKELVNVEKVFGFCNGEVGKRIKEAFSEGKLYREKQYVLGISANELEYGFKSEELVLIQGIIDMFWIENETVYLLDYKTDAIVDWDNGEEELKRKYMAQIRQYKYAIEKITKMPVGMSYIYSFSLGKLIEIT